MNQPIMLNYWHVAMLALMAMYLSSQGESSHTLTRQQQVACAMKCAMKRFYCS